MGLEEIKTAVRELTPEDRRKVALFVLELEKEHVQKTVGPKIAEELESFSKVVQEGIEKLKGFVNKT
ncbi:MAG: hypothetical protein HY961_13930 [Ignavibacteriae bacterium]|nr:hypothetical protein [Ignavibacteriota bacterium]